jgi:hypothetical protein
MSRVVASVLALAIGAAMAMALAGCGGSDAKLLPGETAREISENLDSVQLLVDEGECVDAEDAALEVSTQVEALEGIDPELKQTLQDGAARLNEVVDTCEANLTEDTIEEEAPPETETTEEKPEKKEKKPKKVEPEETQPEEKEPPVEHELPPQAKGEANGHEEAPVEEGDTGSPSGGIGPGSATGEGD